MSMFKIVFYIKSFAWIQCSFTAWLLIYLVLFVLFPHVCVRFVADDRVKMHKVADQWGYKWLTDGNTKNKRWVIWWCDDGRPGRQWWGRATTCKNEGANLASWHQPTFKLVTRHSPPLLNRGFINPNIPHLRVRFDRMMLAASVVPSLSCGTWNCICEESFFLSPDLFRPTVKNTNRWLLELCSVQWCTRTKLPKCWPHK